MNRNGQHLQSSAFRCAGPHAQRQPEASAPGKRIRILLVDDHALVREGLGEILATEKDFQVIGEAADSESTLESVVALQPDIVLLDVEIPGSDVTTTVRRIIALGIRGYLHKSIKRLGLIAAIRSASANDDREQRTDRPQAFAFRSDRKKASAQYIRQARRGFENRRGK